MKNLKNLIANYKSLELKAHVNLEDILNKVTQEVSELVEAIMNWDIPEMKKEAQDAIVNIISASSAIWAEIEDKNWCYNNGITDKDFGNLFLDLWKWNQNAQATRWRYSRDFWNIDSLQEITNKFIDDLLSYVDIKMSLSDIVDLSTAKFSSRIDAYKTKINLNEFIDKYADFPKAWIEFIDISPMLRSQEAMKYICFEMAEKCKDADIIVGLDARWFIFWAKIAEILEKPFVMIRKKGKLPGETISANYSLEYWINEIEIQNNSINKWQKVALIDDLLATWWTILAAAWLVEKLGWIVNNISCVISLEDEELKNSKNRIELWKYKVSNILNF